MFLVTQTWFRGTFIRFPRHGFVSHVLGFSKTISVAMFQFTQKRFRLPIPGFGGLFLGFLNTVSDAMVEVSDSFFKLFDLILN